MNSVLSTKNLLINLLVPAKEKICYRKCPLLLPRVICPLQGLFIMTFYFAKSHALAVIIRISLFFQDTVGIMQEDVAIKVIR